MGAKNEIIMRRIRSRLNGINMTRVKRRFKGGNEKIFESLGRRI